jgi:hypothetical protein
MPSESTQDELRRLRRELAALTVEQQVASAEYGSAFSRFNTLADKAQHLRTRIAVVEQQLLDEI